MKPILFKIGTVSFPSYTFMILIGALVATYVGFKICQRRGLPVIYAIDMAIIGILAGFFGGRLAHVLVEAPAYYWEDPIRVFYFWQGGFVSWGAYLSVLVCWYFYLRWIKQPIWAYFDVASLSFPLAMFFGRGGCLLAGCCFGRPTDFFLHLTFTDPASTAYQFYPNMPLHATQIYLMLNVLIIEAILYWFSKNHWRFQGQLFSICVGLYAIGRTGIEFLRGDADRGVYLSGLISSGQIVMALFFAAAVFLYFYFRKRSLPIPK